MPYVLNIYRIKNICSASKYFDSIKVKKKKKIDR